MESTQFFSVVKELGFPIAVGGTLLLGVIGMVWFLMRQMLLQMKQQREDLLEQRQDDRELTKEVVQHISTTGSHLKTIADFMAQANANAQVTLQNLRDNTVKQDERHATNVNALHELTSNQREMMKQWSSVFQSLGDARQVVQVADASDRQKKRKQVLV